ncbi:hypothetical protein SAMN05444682_115164 [Parapedobacter indicus]|uniref:Uncharacterized protein n=1 Tax=Parapedobacter indicus TaxID=1477437 RepID=A0A1I3V2U0_9SPHI|nr:hypothetical protein CLV26_11513 [Parapedobacter indicus]SFJ89555.1 hypothetical protein SAMN05444682_115164 [Parapedobacter indicus]
MNSIRNAIKLRDWHGREVLVRPEILSNGREIFIDAQGLATDTCRVCSTIYTGWSGRERMCRSCCREQYS